jgi:4-amino-4-deoxy-L-arabinose transferase-like glycosyltransferase
VSDIVTGQAASLRRGPLHSRASLAIPRLTAGAILAGVLVVAAGLRFAALGHNSIWFDEAYVLWMVQRGWGDVLIMLRVDDAHPPLHYLLMKAWIQFAGTGEVAIRIPSACLSVLSVALTYALSRRFLPEPASLLSAFLVAVSPFEVMVGQDARMYALLGFLVLASTLALAVSVERGRLFGWALYAVLAALTVYTHYLGVIVLVSHGIWVAGWERRHLRAWAGSMVVAAVLFAPWAPSLWYQTVHGNGWPWYRRSETFLALTDLLGLLAFGGSLFGMGSYFFRGSQGLPGAMLILLPFLAALGWGVGALRSHPRALGILGLPAVVSLAAISAMSVANLMFYPRWFSFVAPFFAVLLAHGMGQIAERFRGRRDVVLVLLVVGFLAANVPVLDRYFLDPGFRPYPWRAAADLVRREARAGDYFLYVNNAAELCFTYYFREAGPSLTLIPLEASPGTNRAPAFTDAQISRLAQQHPRVWLIATPPFTAKMQQRLLPSLLSAYRVAGTRFYPAIWVHLLEVKSPAPR